MLLAFGKPLYMFDAVFVPEGMEARAVSAALRGARSAIRVAAMGLGPERARRSVERALRASEIRSALVTGVCGLLAPRHKPGSTLLYADVRNAAQTLVQTDAQLTRMLAASLPHAKVGIRALQWDSIVTAAREKQQLAQAYACDAVDMESHAAVTLLQSAGVRTAVLRIGSDAANEDLPNFNAAVNRDGTLNALALLREMVGSPRAGIVMAWNGMTAIAHLKRVIARVTREG
jgi:nucleoside phosphorylase